MSELLKAAEIAQNFDEQSKREFGSEIVLPKATELYIPSPQDLLITQTHPAIPGAELVSVKKNFDRLTAMAGTIFGLLHIKNGAPVTYPGVITTRTHNKEIHFTYLNDAMSPRDIDAGLTPLQKVLLEGGMRLQDPSVGTSHSHNNVAKAATESGHAITAVRALSDSSVMSVISSGRHIAHDWGDSSRGIVPNLTDRSANAPGAFDSKTSDGSTRAVEYTSVALTPDSKVAFVKAESFQRPVENTLDIDPNKLLVGIGLYAAQQLHGNNTQDMMLRAMDTM